MPRLLQALTRAAMWYRAAIVGATAGCLQVAINQGDVWWRGEADGRVLLKSILSPVIAMGLALIASIWTELTANTKP